ncbi:MAG: tRNA 4-thiouridine(8) synthase ThiI, partial [Clostridia bacterium]|nr:tRNA 4-thiouridine(8) synthase ThiI [Clostridia bacterium]
MKQIILVKYGEIILKGLNRNSFENMLMQNMKAALGPISANIWRAQATIYVDIGDENEINEAILRLKKVFGIVAIIKAYVLPKEFEMLKPAARDCLVDELENAKTFKVEAKRSDKKFPLKSPEISATLGGKLLEKFPHLRVDVKNPDIIVTVEIRDEAFVRGNQLKGAGGMPCGSSGRALILISGGIDSPVAGYMMSKRGLDLVGIHFASPPYTSLRAEEKVHDLLSKV